MKKVMKRVLRLMGLRRTREGEVVRIRPVDPITKARRVLSAELMQTVDWRHGDLACEQLERSRYYTLWKKFEGGHKKYSYFELYDRVFGEFSGKQPRVLEIGVYKGASIRTWKEFFGEGSTIVGIDIHPGCAQFEDRSLGVHVRIGSQADTRFLSSLSDEFGSFDIIIDDGSHLTHHVVATFNHAFLHCLAEGGVYFIEDLNTSYWPDYRTSRYSAMDLVLTLSEMTHQFYVANHYRDYVLETYDNHFVGPLVSTLVSEVRVFDSAAAIYKKSHYPPLVFHT